MKNNQIQNNGNQNQILNLNNNNFQGNFTVNNNNAMPSNDDPRKFFKKKKFLTKLTLKKLAILGTIGFLAAMVNSIWFISILGHYNIFTNPFPPIFKITNQLSAWILIIAVICLGLSHDLYRYSKLRMSGFLNAELENDGFVSFTIEF